MTPDELDALLIGNSLPMRKLKALIPRVAASTLPVLIEGETGTGKELVARALHACSGRKGPLVTLNVCAVADTMFEASMFGHTKGAFTGALRDMPGYLTEAHGGTLFLDEISGLSLANQVKLLRAIETKTFRPIGARVDHQSDFRVVAASNASMHHLIETGLFRRDLAQRLSGIQVRLAPLRERKEDLTALIAHLARRARVESDANRPIDTAALAVLQGYDWPGNVRELRHVVESALVLGSGSIVQDDVTDLLHPTSRMPGVHKGSAGRERALLEHLEKYRWDVNAVAQALGVHRATIYRQMRKLGVDDIRDVISTRG
ncbi:MAG: pilR [Gemmatimonadetes bacterium]|nr:pilR [Gemmatimonadota bacterium]